MRRVAVCCVLLPLLASIGACDGDSPQSTDATTGIDAFGEIDASVADMLDAPFELDALVEVDAGMTPDVVEVDAALAPDAARGPDAGPVTARPCGVPRLEHVARVCDLTGVFTGLLRPTGGIVVVGTARDSFTCAAGTADAVTVRGAVGPVLVRIDETGRLQAGGYLGTWNAGAVYDAALLGDDVIVVGEYRSRMTLNRGRPDEILLVDPTGGVESFVLRARSNGTVVWAVSMGASDSPIDRADSVVVGSDDSIYVSGQTQSESVFGSMTRTWTIGPGVRTGYIARMTSSGAFEWVRFVSGRDTGVTDLALDGTRVVFTIDANRVQTLAQDGDVTVVHAAAGARQVVGAYSALGRLEWIRAFPGISAEGTALASAPGGVAAYLVLEPTAAVGSLTIDNQYGVTARFDGASGATSDARRTDRTRIGISSSQAALGAVYEGGRTVFASTWIYDHFFLTDPVLTVDPGISATSSFVGCTESGSADLAWVRRIQPATVLGLGFASTNRVSLLVTVLSSATLVDDPGAAPLDAGQYVVSYVLD